LNPGQFHFVFLLPLFHLENRVCLSRGVQVVGAAWRAATKIMAGDREVRWRRVRSAPGTWRLGARVSWLSLKTQVDGL
jgi:hypothetical protein